MTEYSVFPRFKIYILGEPLEDIGKSTPHCCDRPFVHHCVITLPHGKLLYNAECLMREVHKSLNEKQIAVLYKFVHHMSGRLQFCMRGGDSTKLTYIPYF